MLNMEVIPGKSIGAFALGMSISDAITFVQQKNKIISHAELKYNEQVFNNYVVIPANNW